MDLVQKYPSIASKVLKSLRLKNEYSQEYLGELIGKSRSTVHRIENVVRKLQPSELAMYLKSLNTSYDDFLKTLSSLVFLQNVTNNVEEEIDQSRELSAADRIESRSEIIALLEKYFSDKSIDKVYLFGSIARNEFDHNSDIDLYLEVDEKAKISIFDLSKMRIDIADITGRTSDLVLKGSEYSFMKSAIKKEKVLIYEQAKTA